MAGWDDEGRGSGTLSWAIRTAGIVGFLGLVATQYLARDREPAAGTMQVAQGGPGRVADPETTGSLAAGARTTRIDPCGPGAWKTRP